jgi:putative hydrolase of the HAD superfamily
MSDAAPKAVVFDLDQTLTDRHASLQRWGQRLLQDFAPLLTADGLDAQLLEILLEQDAAAYHTKQQIFDHVAARLPWTRTVLEEEIRAHWNAMFPKSAVGVADLQPTIQGLCDRGLRVGIITNGSGNMQYGKLDALGLWELCDPVVVSGVFGVNKPDARIFEHALEQLGLPAADVWYVGDHPRNDILGAEAVGITPVWVEGHHPWPDDHPRPQRIVRHIREVGDLLGDVRP